MLTKHNVIEIPSDNPFANDKLERKKIIENLTRLVESTNQPFVISIEAPWGWGKTTFINMWKTYLESLGHTCLYFNAWENDFVEDPLIAFIGEIGKALGAQKGKRGMSAQFKKIQKIGGKIVRRTLPLAIQISTQGLLSQETVKKASNLISVSSDEIAGFMSELAVEKIKQYESDKNGIVDFKKELADFAKSLSDNESKKPPLVFFVDELDRCKPDFSLALLERIKHIFSVEGVIFVLGIDRGQIEQSIKSIYGQGMDEDGYLRRFIDYRFQLPQPSTEKFCQFLFERFSIWEALNGRKGPHEEKDTLIRVFSRLAQYHKFSLRKIEQCFTEMNLVLRTVPNNIILFPEMLAFLTALKSYSPDQYLSLRQNMSYTELKNFIEHVKKDLNVTDRYDLWLQTRIHANLIVDYLDRYNVGKDYNQAIADLQENSKEDLPSEIRIYSTEILQIIQRAEFESRYRGLKYTFSRLDLVEDLVVNK